MGFLSIYQHITRFKMATPQQHLAVQSWINHPLPWRIEHDWTVEVHASDGHIVAKCSTQEEAESVIKWAKEQQEIIDSIWIDEDAGILNVDIEKGTE